MQITRRNALMGATAAAAVTGLTVTPLAIKAGSAKAAVGDDPVIGLSDQLRAASTRGVPLARNRLGHLEVCREN